MQFAYKPGDSMKMEEQNDWVFILVFPYKSRERVESITAHE
jgi:hypothetical protein